MSQSQVLELAQQGDAKAISALINRSLNPQGITAKVICQADQMKILVESLDIPDKAHLTEYLTQGLSKIGVSLRYLEIYGKRDGQKEYAWTKAFQVEGDRFTPVAIGQAPTPAVSDAIVPDAAADNPFLAPTTGKRSVQGLSQDDILAQAQGGNLAAIETIVRAALADKEDLVPLIELNGSVLKVTIETKQFLDGPAFCGDFGTKMNVLAGGVIKELAIYKRKSEKNLPFLMKQVTLFTAAEAAVATAPPEALSYEALKKERPNGQSSAMRHTEPSHTYVSSGSLGRPTGVLVVAILYFVFGGFCVVAGGFTLIATLFLRAAMDSAGSNAAAMGMVGFFVFVMAGVLLFLGLARIWIGIGLLHMNAWARNWALRLEGVSAMRCFFAMIQGNVIGGILGMAISGTVFFYLAQAGMSDRFH
jgi:hypothetical protein